jgi:hypothetical protein
MWFKKTPPVVKYKLPPWIAIAAPIVFTIFIGLLGIVYNGLASNIEALEEEKANKEITYKQIEQNQKILEKHQQQLDETLKVIIRIQTQMEPPRSIMLKKENTTEEKLPLTPKEFEDYMKMSPENREAFRKLHPSYESLPK